MTSKKTGRPLWGNVLIKPELEKRTTKSGLDLPTNAQSGTTSIGTVQAKGSGSIALDGSPIPMEVEPGQRVLYESNKAHEAWVENEKLHMVDQLSILYIF